MTGLARTLNAARKFSTTALRREGGCVPPGDNLPFKIENRYALTAKFILFFGSAFSLPFVAVKLQLSK
uniref:Cytochrome c oxidase subunit 7C, mitochondrial n=1 Tax=Lepeophtheirus salmonis TaxID=72036 RepID=A0A0K2SXE5_LEPSM